jgi:hypothetical protein
MTSSLDWTTSTYFPTRKLGAFVSAIHTVYLTTPMDFILVTTTGKNDQKHRFLENDI